MTASYAPSCVDLVRGKNLSCYLLIVFYGHNVTVQHVSVISAIAHASQQLYKHVSSQQSELTVEASSACASSFHCAFKARLPLCTQSSVTDPLTDAPSCHAHTRERQSHLTSANYKSISLMKLYIEGACDETIESSLVVLQLCKRLPVHVFPSFVHFLTQTFSRAHHSSHSVDQL